MEIITTEQLHTYLTDSGIASDSLQQLEGGIGNFVWRMIGEPGTSIVIKHAEPYVARSSRRMPFPCDRMNHENAALTILPHHLPFNNLASIPKVYRYDAENFVLTLEDGGPRTLKAAYTDPSLDIEGFGMRLGKWLACLHKQTAGVGIGDNQTGKAIYRFPYANLAAVLEKYGYDPAIGERINDQYGSLLQTDDECVCHGDFWPGNILTDDRKLMVVDWEMVRRDCGATDVGQFAAEAYLLDRFRGGRGLLPAFLRGYRGNSELGGRFLQRVAVHLGVHLAFWPTRVSWGTEEDTKECVRLGMETISQAIA